MPCLDKEQINSASTDLEIDDKITLVDFGGYHKKKTIVESYTAPNPYNSMFVDGSEYEPTIRHTELDLKEFPEGIWVRPGVGILASTKSFFKMPHNVVGQILLKSSRGREFYQSCMAGFIDNGFQGNITLEIYAPVVPIFIGSGLRIVQVRFDSLEESDFHYGEQPSAKYHGQVGVQGSKDARY